MNTKYVCSLELSKKLRELGVAQESDFYWIKTSATEWSLTTGVNKENIRGWREYYPEQIIYAFHVGELGEMLTNSRVLLSYGRTISGGFRFDFGDQQAIVDGYEANARAKMLIYLIENKLMEGGVG